MPETFKEAMEEVRDNRATIAALRTALLAAADALSDAARWNAPWPTSENKGDPDPRYQMMCVARDAARSAANAGRET
jgi:hypothetical protein